MKNTVRSLITALFVAILFLILTPPTARADDFCYYSVGTTTYYPLGQSNAPTVILYGEGDANPAMMMITVLDQSPAWNITYTYEFYSGLPPRMLWYQPEHFVTGNPYPQVVKIETTNDLCRDINTAKRLTLYIRRASDNVLVYRGSVAFIN